MDEESLADMVPKCRVCFEGAEAPGGVLVSPCNCRGTQKFVHKSCLTQWQRITLLQPNPRRAYECSVCKTAFSIKPSERNKLLKFLRPMLPNFLTHLVATSVGFAAIFFSRDLPAVLHILVAYMALYFTSRIASRHGIADGDPVPAVMSGRYLVSDAIPRGSVFFRSVILILQHDPNVGSLGVIVNNPQNIGGPVPSMQPVFLSNFEGPGTSAVRGIDGLFWGRGESRNYAEAAVRDARLKVMRGVSGWGPRQLDGEVRRGSWKVVLADAETALSLHTDSSLWQTLYYSHAAAA